MANLETTELKIEGMHCVSCERTIRSALAQVPGTIEAQVNFVSGEAKVKSEQGKTNPDQLIKAVQSTGYNAILINGHTEASIAAGETLLFKKELITVILSALLTLPLIVQMFFDWAGKPNLIPLPIQFLLASLVQFGFGWRFYVGSYYALKTLTGNMDLLIGLGTSAAYFYSVAVMAFGWDRHVYFESSSAIITLILFGRLLEMQTKQKASGALKSLLKLQPKMARVQQDGAWREIPIENIKVGDLFQIRPGEKIPIDGEVVEGDSYINESMLTGESIPVHKKKGETIFGGTLNENGSLQAKATAVGGQTALAGIIRLVQEAQSSRAPIQNLADKISAIFVPIVVAIALVTFFIWWGVTKNFTEALINSVAVLVIACPCALGMATPTVIMVASGRGARSGILIKNAEALQAAEKLAVVAVDKTGTLTEGRPKLTDVIPDTIENRSIAASLEDLSEHPIGKMIAEAHPEQKSKVTAFEMIPGRGVKGRIGSDDYRVGSLKWMEELGIKSNNQVTEPLEKQGKTVVCLTKGQEPIAYLAVADTLRSTSIEGIAKLKALGMEVVMLTGDQKLTAKAIAEQAGIATYIAEILPKDKAAAIIKLKERNKMVAMVGDGINDAPALVAADVGFAMRTGTDIAMESSDITLMRNDLRSCADAIELSRATFRKVRQNLFFAFCYNVLGIPLAAIGFLNPIIAGGAMALSSVCVVTNSLLLNRWKPKKGASKGI